MGVLLLFQVIGTALGLGIVHVMTGPDHLSALSTLAVGKPLKIAFGLGVRWGCGHSFGLLIVAIIFFALGRSVDLDALTFYADIFVGIFMVLLGGWYMLKAFRERMQYLQDRERKEAMELLHKQRSESMDIAELHQHRNVEEANYNMEPIVVDRGLSGGTPPRDAHGALEQIEMEPMDQMANGGDVSSNGDDTSGSVESDSKGLEASNSKSSAILRLDLFLSAISDSLSLCEMATDSTR